MSTNQDTQGSSQAPARPFHRTRKVVRFLSAVDHWKRRGGDLKHRASFPLLRKVLRDEWQASRQFPALAQFTSDELERSIFLHRLLIVLMVPVALWALICTVKGVTVLVRFDYWHVWLLFGVPLLVYSCARIFLSWKSFKAQSAFLAAPSAERK